MLYHHVHVHICMYIYRIIIISSIVCQDGSSLASSTLRRREGWLHWNLREPGLEAVCVLIFGQLLIMSRTFYVRVLVHVDLCERLREACPSSSAQLAKHHVVGVLSCCLVVACVV